jgi:hypothetical protein
VLLEAVQEERMRVLRATYLRDTIANQERERPCGKVLQCSE